MADAMDHEMQDKHPEDDEMKSTSSTSSSSSSGSETSSSSSSSDGEGQDIAGDDLESLMSLEKQLAENPNLYEKHAQYVELLRKLKLRVKLREAHEAMATRFPLSEQLWLDWVNDELEHVTSAEDFAYIKNLFQRAVEDYLSIELWAQYLDFLSELDMEVQSHSPEGVKTMRDACEAALTASGLHISQGGRLWAAYRGYEKSVLEALVSGGSAGPQDIVKASERVRGLYQRQLHVPLSGNDAVLKEYEAWEQSQGKPVPPHISKAADKAAEALSLRSAYEDSVAPGKEADASLLATYLAYVKLEQVSGDPGRVQLVFERAVAAFPLTVELWMQYIKYMMDKVPIPSFIAKVTSRACRNCYWSGQLWATAIRAADRAGQTAEQITKLKTDALMAGMQSQEDYMEVLLAHCDALRRRTSPGPGAAGTAQGGALRQAFSEATALMNGYFADYPDRLLRLPSYWSHCEVNVLHDTPAARQVWEEALKTKLNMYSEVWLAYAAMERHQRQLSEARAVYRRAVSKKMEEQGQYVAALEWLKFEREEGSAQDYMEAQSKVNHIMEAAAAAAAAAAANDLEATAAKAAAKEAMAMLSPEEKKRMRQQNDPNFKGGKEAKKQQVAKGQPQGLHMPVTGANREQLAPGQVKRLHETEDPDAAQKRARLHAPEHTTVHPTAAATAAAQQHHVHAPEHDMHDNHDGAGSGDAQHDQHGMKRAQPKPLAEEHSVFVKNLPHNTGQEALKRFFADCGEIVSVRIPQHPNGSKRNFGYVDFNTEEAVVKAVALNGRAIPNKPKFPLIIAKSAPPLPRGATRGRGRGAGRGQGGRTGVDPSSIPGHDRGYSLADKRGSHDDHDISANNGGDHAKDHDMIDDEHHQHPGREAGERQRPGDGFSGGRGRGRGRPPLGVGHAGRHGHLEHPKQHLDLKGASGAGAAQKAEGAAQQPAAQAPEAAAPKSNADFRAMLLGRK